MSPDPCYERFDQDYLAFIQNSDSRVFERRVILELAGALNGRDVIDLACGTGDFGRLLLKQGARSAVGIDLSTAMIAHARRLSAEHGDGMRFVVGDGTRVDESGSFDIVAAAWLFSHAQSQAELHRMYRAAVQLLRPGGQLLAIFINPLYRLEKGDNARYSPRAIAQRQVGDHHEVDVQFAEGRLAVVTDHQWSTEQHAQAADAAGLHALQWRLPLPQPEDVGAKPPGFWDAFVGNPPARFWRHGCRTEGWAARRGLPAACTQSLRSCIIGA